MREIRFRQTLRQLGASMTAIVLATVTVAATASPDSDDAVDLSGSWQLNEELSDDPSKLLREKTEERDSDGRFGKRARARRAKKKIEKAKEKIETLRESFEGYEKLEIVQEDPAVTITNSEDVVHTIFTDGRSTDDLGKNESVGAWKDGRLSLQRRGERGNGQQTYTLEDDRLVVMTTISGERRKTIELRRVYDRQE